MAKIGVTKARRRDFELQSSEPWGNKNDLSAQLQIQLIGFETKSVPFFLVKVCTLKKTTIFLGSSYYEMIVSQESKMVWGSKLYVNVTEHDWSKRAIGFPVWPNASQNKSLQNAFPIFKCFFRKNEKPLQDAAHALLLQKPVHDSIFLHEFSP